MTVPAGAPIELRSTIDPPSTISACPDGFFARSREAGDLGDGRNRRQRLAAKTQRGDVIEIIGGGEFAGGVTAKGEFDFGWRECPIRCR